MATLFNSDIQRGRLLENLVYIELLRKKEMNATVNIGFWKNLRGEEVDFIVTREKIPREYNPAATMTMINMAQP